MGGTALEPTRAPVPTEFPTSSPSPLSRSGPWPVLVQVKMSDRRIATPASWCSRLRSRPWQFLPAFGEAGVKGVRLKVSDVVNGPTTTPCGAFGAGRRERTIPLAPEVLESIDAYLQDRSDARLGPCRRGDPLLVTAKGKCLGRAALNWHMERWCTRAEVVRPAGELPTRSGTPTPRDSLGAASRSRSCSSSSGTRTSRRRACISG